MLLCTKERKKEEKIKFVHLDFDYVISHMKMSAEKGQKRFPTAKFPFRLNFLFNLANSLVPANTNQILYFFGRVLDVRKIKVLDVSALARHS